MKEIASVMSALLPQIKPTHLCCIGGMASFISDGDIMLIKNGFLAQLINFGPYFICK